ncbi:MAG: xylose isomerase [Gemmatimonadaceae bacterium]|jgi:hypothetical protein|nr:xylose isomerase [Gemmatimonadaceae bacterium]
MTPMARKAAAKPRLRLCAAAWTMTNYPSAKRQWSADTKVRKAKEAGFDGFSAGAQDDITKACRKHDMELVGGVDVGRVADAKPKMKAFADAGATHVNVQLCDHDTPTAKALPVARAVMQAGDLYGIKPAIEWHRDTCTETPEKGLALAKAYESKYRLKLRTNFDHSHPAIVKQVRPADFAKRLIYRPDLLRQGDLLHLRTFTGSHCQTPITNGRGQLDGDFVTWRDSFCRPLLASWLKGARRGRELWAVVELGPPGSGYALECFPDVWQDACVAREEIARIWASLLRKYK